MTMWARGEGAGAGASEYLAIFQIVFQPLAVEYEPELVLVSAG